MAGRWYSADGSVHNSRAEILPALEQRGLVQLAVRRLRMEQRPSSTPTKMPTQAFSIPPWPARSQAGPATGPIIPEPLRGLGHCASRFRARIRGFSSPRCSTWAGTLMIRAEREAAHPGGAAHGRAIRRVLSGSVYTGSMASGSAAVLAGAGMSFDGGAVASMLTPWASALRVIVGVPGVVLGFFILAHWGVLPRWSTGFTGAHRMIATLRFPFRASSSGLRWWPGRYSAWLGSERCGPLHRRAPSPERYRLLARLAVPTNPVAVVSAVYRGTVRTRRRWFEPPCGFQHPHQCLCPCSVTTWHRANSRSHPECVLVARRRVCSRYSCRRRRVSPATAMRAHLSGTENPASITVRHPAAWRAGCSSTSRTGCRGGVSHRSLVSAPNAGGKNAGRRVWVRQSGGHALDTDQTSGRDCRDRVLAKATLVTSARDHSYRTTFPLPRFPKENCPDPRRAPAGIGLFAWKGGSCAPGISPRCRVRPSHHPRWWSNSQGLLLLSTTLKPKWARRLPATVSIALPRAQDVHGRPACGAVSHRRIGLDSGACGSSAYRHRGILSTGGMRTNILNAFRFLKPDFRLQARANDPAPIGGVTRPWRWWRRADPGDEAVGYTINVSGSCLALALHGLSSGGVAGNRFAMARTTNQDQRVLEITLRNDQGAGCAPGMERSLRHCPAISISAADLLERKKPPVSSRSPPNQDHRQEPVLDGLTEIPATDSV